MNISLLINDITNANWSISDGVITIPKGQDSQNLLHAIFFNSQILHTILLTVGFLLFVSVVLLLWFNREGLVDHGQSCYVFELHKIYNFKHLLASETLPKHSILVTLNCNFFLAWTFQPLKKTTTCEISWCYSWCILCSPGLNLMKNLPCSVTLHCREHHRHLYCRHTECDIEPRHCSHNTSLTDKHVKCILTGAQRQPTVRKWFYFTLSLLEKLYAICAERGTHLLFCAKNIFSLP